MLQATLAVAFNWRAIVAAGAIIVLCCFTVAWRSYRQIPEGPASVTPSSPQVDPTADHLVIEYMGKVLILRGEFEARNPGWSGQVRRKGLTLAGLIGNVDPEKLRPARKIVQHEYKGWALLMVARTFGAEDKERDAEQQRIKYATLAIHELEAGLAMMRDIDTHFTQGTGGKETADLYEWMMGESADVERSKYLKAIALAVIARAGGDHTRADVLDELASISPTYLLSYPPDNNPDLKWARTRSEDPRPEDHSMTPLLWIGLGFSAALVVFLMAGFFVILKAPAIPQAAYNSLHFLTALCGGFAGGFLAGEALFRWEQQLAGGTKWLFSGTAGFALFALVWLKYPRRNPPPPPNPPA